MRDEIRRSVSRLLQDAGASGNFQLQRTHGGGNNRVHVIEDGGLWLLKEYFYHPDDLRDRLGTEFSVLTYLWQQGVRQVPQPYGQDRRLHLGLYQYIDGESVTPDTLQQQDVAAAAQFVRDINAALKPDARQLPTASEAWFSLEEHLQGIDRRLNRLQREMTSEDQLDNEAAAFVNGSLTAMWRRIETGIRQAAKNCLCEPLGQTERCLSPSDFGFHNAFRTKAGLVFYDFEYAGWDDPAKLVCDFFCQEKVPVPLDYLPLLQAAVVDLVQDKLALEQRISWLLPAYRIKWCCILLNEFLAVSRQRRQFAQAGGMNRRRQLERAKQRLQEMEEL